MAQELVDRFGDRMWLVEVRYVTGAIDDGELGVAHPLGEIAGDIRGCQLSFVPHVKSPDAAEFAGALRVVLDGPADETS